MRSRNRALPLYWARRSHIISRLIASRLVVRDFESLQASREEGSPDMSAKIKQVSDSEVCLNLLT